MAASGCWIKITCVEKRVRRKAEKKSETKKTKQVDLIMKTGKREKIIRHTVGGYCGQARFCSRSESGLAQLNLPQPVGFMVMGADTGTFSHIVYHQ